MRLSKPNPFALLPLIFCFFIIYGQNSHVPGMFNDGLLYAALGIDMAENGNWILPGISPDYLDQYTQHPPLFFILEGLVFSVLPYSWTLFRILGIVFIFAIFLLTFGFLYKKHRPWAYCAGSFFFLIPELIKNARYPNLENPLAFFIFLGLFVSYFAIEKKNFYYWLASGICFGLAALTKGPPALILPISIILYCLIEKKWFVFKSAGPYIALIIGAFMFSLWPLGMYKIDQFGHFMEHYWHGQLFKTLVNARGQEHMDYFFYLKVFGKRMAPIFLTTLIGIFYVFKDNNPFGKLIAIFWISLVALFSIIKFKFAHYLVPGYPAMAILSGYALIKLPINYQKNYTIYLPRLVALVGVVLLVFPITARIRRDPMIFKIFSTMEMITQQNKKWIIVENAFPFPSLANLAALVRRESTVGASISQLKKYLFQPIKNKVIVIKKDHYDTLSMKFKRKINNSFHLVIKSMPQNIFVFLSKDLKNKNSPLILENKKGLLP